MNFVQIEFVGFMLAVWTAYWLLPGRRAQNALLLGASAVFYGWVHPWFLLLLGSSAVLDFVCGRAMAARPDRKRVFLALSLAGNLGMLAYFKYFGFFVANVAAAFESLGLPLHPGTLQIWLPVGISFYTFQTLSYSVDVYRGELEPRRDLLDYLVYVSFFPQLVAGPIERAGRLLPQVEAERRFSFDRAVSGTSLAMWGAFKKVCVADTLAPYVDKVFTLREPDGPLVWVATFAFMVQIYADFSGYTDIARGTARTLGFELVENFRSPWLAASTPEFWQRWHISLSTWIRDYVLAPLLGTGTHIPLGRFVVAVSVTFVLVGVWHGAAWNFVLFGVFHAFWMSVYTVVERHGPDWLGRVPLGRPLAVVFHLVAVCLVGSLIFREPHLDRLVQHLQRSPFTTTQEGWTAVSVLLGITVAATLPLVLGGLLGRVLGPRLEGSPWALPLQTTS